MSLFHQLAQVAQLAGAKRKLPHDDEPDSMDPAYHSHPTYHSDLKPCLAQNFYAQPSVQRSTLGHRYQGSQTPYTSSCPQAGIVPYEQSRTLLERLGSSVHSSLAPISTQACALTDSSVSPLTEHGAKHWHDTSSTANTSDHSSPKLDGSLNGPHFTLPAYFPLPQYPHQFSSLQINHNCASHNSAAAFPKLDTHNSLGAKPGFSQRSLNMAVNLDCAEDIPCSDPDCSDGIPCDGEHLLACDKDDCDDAIPCPGAHGWIPGSFYTDENQDCNMGSNSDGYCCSEKCLAETRCPSPCFEEDCDVAPCAVEQQTPWKWTDTSHHNGSMNGCIDPRHTFRDHKSSEHANASWTNRLHEQLSFATRIEDRTTDYHSLTSNNSHHIYLQSGSHESQLKQGKSALQDPRIKDAHNHKDDGGSSKSRHCQQVRRPVRENRHTCKWIMRGDSNDSNAEICGIGFADPTSLQSHAVSHVEGLQREDDLFPCRWLNCNHRYCDGFLARPKLKRHLMVHTGATPYKCDEPGCNVEMKTKDALDKHKRTHTGAKPYKCTHPHCESRFATSTELKTHLIVHSGQKPHRCPRCGDCFADSSNLSKHKKVHEVPKFKCPDCDYKMKRWDQMRRHFKSQGHGLEIVENKKKEADYKRAMQDAFDKLTPEEKTLPLSREESMNPESLAGDFVARSAGLSLRNKSPSDEKKQDADEDACEDEEEKDYHDL